MSSSPRNNGKARALWSTASMRLALGFAVFFGLGSALLIAGVDYGLLRFAEAEVRDGLRHQLAVMRDDLNSDGPDGLVNMLEAHQRNREARRYLFLVITPEGRSFSNGLRRNAVNDTGFRYNAATKHRAARWPDQRPNMLVLSETMPDGTLLAIGRDTQHLEELRGGVRRYALWGGVAMIALALTAGLAMGYMFLRRLDQVNGAVDRIMSGDASERLPPIGFGREFDTLAANLNHMLDRQEATMSALKTVSQGIAHDLRTPLGRLRNRLDEIDIAGEDPEARQLAVDNAYGEVDQLNRLLEAMLALARVEGGSTAVARAPVDLAGLMRAMAEAYRPAIEIGGGQLQSAVGDSPLMVAGDTSLLTMLLTNLIDNALIHGGNPPQITLTATDAGDHVTVAVGDRGPGIPPEEQARVFDRFYRMDHSRTRPGAGLGLAMVQAVARWHGGMLALHDHAPGLLVELTLPKATPPEVASPNITP